MQEIGLNNKPLHSDMIQGVESEQDRNRVLCWWILKKPLTTYFF